MEPSASDWKKRKYYKAGVSLDGEVFGRVLWQAIDDERSTLKLRIDLNSN